MGRIRGPEQQRVRSPRRPAMHVGGAKIGRVELGPGNLGEAVDASGSSRGRVPLLPSRQGLTCKEPGFLSERQARESESNAARSGRPFKYFANYQRIILELSIQ